MSGCVRFKMPAPGYPRNHRNTRSKGVFRKNTNIFCRGFDTEGFQGYLWGVRKKWALPQKGAIKNNLTTILFSGCSPPPKTHTSIAATRARGFPKLRALFFWFGALCRIPNCEQTPARSVLPKSAAGSRGSCDSLECSRSPRKDSLQTTRCRQHASK